MNTPEQYHQKYPIGSTWLLPVTISAHSHPDYPDTWDPRPVQIKPTTGKHYHRLWPHTTTLDTLLPARTQPQSTDTLLPACTQSQSTDTTPITLTLTLTPTQYATLCTALLNLKN